MLEELTVEEKLRLVRFMCAFAWADLDVSEREQALLSALIRKLDLPDEARLEAESWIEHPPDEEELDPNDIPLAQRRLFVSAATEIRRARRAIVVDEDSPKKKPPGRHAPAVPRDAWPSVVRCLAETLPGIATAVPAVAASPDLGGGSQGGASPV